jgi:hypothetical protein
MLCLCLDMPLLGFRVLLLPACQTQSRLHSITGRAADADSVSYNDSVAKTHTGVTPRGSHLKTNIICEAQAVSNSGEQAAVDDFCQQLQRHRGIQRVCPPSCCCSSCCCWVCCWWGWRACRTWQRRQWCPAAKGAPPAAQRRYSSSTGGASRAVLGRETLPVAMNTI